MRINIIVNADCINREIWYIYIAVSLIHFPVDLHFDIVWHYTGNSYVVWVPQKKMCRLIKRRDTTEDVMKTVTILKPYHMQPS